MQIKQDYIVVLLVKGQGSKRPLIVYPHEVPVLQALHGDDAVEMTDEKSPIPAGVFETDEEYSRLEQYYRGNADIPNPTAAAYPRLKDFEDLFEGLEVEEGDDEKEELIAQAQSLGIDANRRWGVPKLQDAINEALAA